MPSDDVEFGVICPPGDAARPGRRESSTALRRVAEHGVGWTDHGRDGDPAVATPVRVEPDRDPDREAP
jgi:hypothetical protein